MLFRHNIFFHADAAPAAITPRHMSAPLSAIVTDYEELFATITP